MSSKYILISFYPVTDNRWLLYGHIALGWNESLGEFETKLEACGKAFQFGLPVMLGEGSKIDDVLEKLVEDN